MSAAVTDAERVAARNSPGLARQFDDCTFIRTEFRPLKPSATTPMDLPVTPVKSPPKELSGMQSLDPLAREMKRAGANTLANQTLGGRSSNPLEHLTPSRSVRRAAAPVTPSTVATVVGAAHGSDGDASQHVLKETSLLENRLHETTPEATAAKIQQIKKHEALHSRLMKSGYYSAAAKVRPLYSSATPTASATPGTAYADLHLR
jgi:hypothetical protein